jgi:hypothetical protein
MVRHGKNEEDDKEEKWSGRVDLNPVSTKRGKPRKV